MTAFNDVTKPQILVLVVLYKCSLADSETINSLLTQEADFSQVKLVVWDNSPEPVPASDQDSLRINMPFEYISCPENLPLSKVYNRVVDRFDFEYIMLLDQDSHLPVDYIRTIDNQVKTYPDIKLFLPIVKNQDLIVSPGEFWVFKGKHWKQEKTGVMPAKNMLAITSGMTVAGKYFAQHSFRFDERLNLYGIDTRFMLEYAKKERDLAVIPCKLKHSTVLWSNPSAEVMLSRFKNLRKSWPVVFTDRPLALLLSRLYGRLLCLKFAIKYRDIRFLS